MEVSIKQIGTLDGQERFVLVQTDSRQVVTARDVSEASLRRFFRARGCTETLLDECFQRARELYRQRIDQRMPLNQLAETLPSDDVFYELDVT